MESAEYDQFPLGQLHELRKQRGYRKKDTEAVRRMRMAAMAPANKKHAGANTGDIDTSASVSGNRDRTSIVEVDIGDSASGNLGKRPILAAAQ